MKETEEFTMTELWLVKADWERTFIGTIERTKNPDGTPLLKGRADINGTEITAEAATEEELTDKLDALCTEILEKSVET